MKLKLITIGSFVIVCVIMWSVYNAQHSDFIPTIPPNMQKRATGWGAILGTNKIAFQTLADLQIFQSLDPKKQANYIIQNNGCVVHFTQEADSNTLVIPSK